MGDSLSYLDNLLIKSNTFKKFQIYSSSLRPGSQAFTGKNNLLVKILKV